VSLEGTRLWFVDNGGGGGGDDDIVRTLYLKGSWTAKLTYVPPRTK
jgi:hypothetical protein